MPVNISPLNNELIIDLENKTKFLFEIHLYNEIIVRETNAIGGGTRRKYRLVQDRSIRVRIEVVTYERQLIHC